MDFLLDGLYLEATGSYYSATSYLTTRSKEFAAYLYKEDGSYQQVGEDKDQGNSGNKDQRYRITFLKGAVGYDHSFGKHKVAALFVADLNIKSRSKCTEGIFEKLYKLFRSNELQL